MNLLSFEQKQFRLNYLDASPKWQFFGRWILKSLKFVINSYNVKLDPRWRKVNAFSVNQLINTLITLKQEKDCKASLCKNFSIINFYNLSDYFSK